MFLMLIISDVGCSISDLIGSLICPSKIQSRQTNYRQYKSRCNQLQQIGVDTYIKRHRQNQLKDNRPKQHQRKAGPYRSYPEPVDQRLCYNNRTQAGNYNAYTHADVGKTLVLAYQVAAYSSTRVGKREAGNFHPVGSYTERTNHRFAVAGSAHC